jgi:hypothetical protein
MLEELKAKNTARISSLLAEVAALNDLNDRLTSQLAFIEHGSDNECEYQMCGKKRGRSITKDT